MKGFDREDLKFSLCGLNCSLCTMKHDGFCPGCGGGTGNQGCSIARCSLKHGGFDYCFECEEYPCSRYDGITEFDSFITHRNQLKDVEKARRIGLDAYHKELDEKAEILEYLLSNYNDGRRKTFFSVAVNLLDLSEIKNAVPQIDKEACTVSDSKQKALIAVKYFNKIAKCTGTELKLKKKPSKK